MLRIHPAVPKSILPIPPITALLSHIRLMEDCKMTVACGDFSCPLFYDDWKYLASFELDKAHEEVLSVLSSRRRNGAPDIDALFVEMLRSAIHHHAVERVGPVILLMALKALESNGHYVLGYDPDDGAEIIMRLGPAGAPNNADVLLTLRRMKRFTTMLESSIACDLMDTARELFQELPWAPRQQRETYWPTPTSFA